MDFIDVVLDPAADGQPLTIEFRGAEGGDAEFRVQIWKLLDSGTDVRPQRVPIQSAAAAIFVSAGPSGQLSYTIPAIDKSECNRLGLIITRTDPKESSDPDGEYTILVRPGADGDDGTSTLSGAHHNEDARS